MHEPILVTAAIETWMVILEFSVKHAVSTTLLKCCKSYEKEVFKDWIRNWPTQFSLLSLELKFTEQLCKIFPTRDLRSIENATSNLSPKKKDPRGRRDGVLKLRPNPAVIENFYERATKQLKILLSEIYLQIE